MTALDTAPGAHEQPSPAQRRAAMRSAIFGQCGGQLGSLVFTNGLMLLYLGALGMEPAGIIRALAIPAGAAGLLIIPLAHVCDRLGIKRVGALGLLLTIAGYAGIAGAAWFDAGPPALVLAVAGIVVFASGYAMFSAGWFALLAGIVPPDVRGRFFGVLRFSWQAVAIAFSSAVTPLLSGPSQLRMFQVVMALLLLGQIDRLWQYRRIPEVTGPRPPRVGLPAALGEIVRAPRYMGFCSYLFLLYLFTANAPALFALIATNVAHLSARTVTLLGVALMAGNLAGFAVGGWAVDRIGTKVLFLLCHLGFGVLLMLYPFRAALGAEAWAMAALNLGFGTVSAASTIAITTEMLALAPPERKSLSTGVCQTLMSAGSAMSGILASGAIASGMLRDRWTFLGQEASAFDALLVLDAVVVVLLVVTLGLVPSVVGKAAAPTSGAA
jgi:MFS family permease